jgi:hypothetical protein
VGIKEYRKMKIQDGKVNGRKGRMGGKRRDDKLSVT